MELWDNEMPPEPGQPSDNKGYIAAMERKAQYLINDITSGRRFPSDRAAYDIIARLQKLQKRSLEKEPSAKKLKDKFYATINYVLKQMGSEKPIREGKLMGDPPGMSLGFL